MRTSVLGLALAAMACGGSSGSSTPTAPYVPPPPAAVMLTSASSVPSADGFTDDVHVMLTNSGGAGTFYLEFWGEPLSTTPSGCYLQPGQTSCPHGAQQKIAKSQLVTVSGSYNEALVYTVPSNVSGVKVFTQPVNTAVYAETDCKTVQSFGTCP